MDTNNAFDKILRTFLASLFSANVLESVKYGFKIL
jgi:hypothetical protein